MTPTLRVLIADDSVTVRRLLSETLSNEPLMEVCHAARDGREAVTQFPIVRPDVVVLDIEMPVMDGIETVLALRKLDSRVPIIMFSSLTARGGAATLDALTAGATDFVTKPTRAGHLHEAIAHIRKSLIPMITHWGKWYREECQNQILLPANMRQEPRPAVSVRREPLSAGLRAAARINSTVEVIAIGSAAGGPNALMDVLKSLPKQFPIPILIAQHMPPLFTGMLAERLNQVCPLPVGEAFDGAALEAGQVWIAPGDRHLVTEKHGLNLRIRLNDNPPMNSCRPSADVLFSSVAETFGDSAVAVVLTGMGHDGLEGCRHIHNRGGKVIAQDQATSVVWSMPRVVAEAGLADFVLPLSEIAQQLSRLSSSGRNLPNAGH